jgi:hypothetical protein
MHETSAKTPWLRIVAIGVALAGAVAVILLAFSWPNVTAEPRNLPVAIVGPSAAVHQVETAIQAKSPNAISFREVDSRSDAVALIKQRSVYGAIVLAQTPEVLTATAASPVVSQLLSSAAAELQGTATEIVPLASTDSRGAGLATAAFPLVIGGLLGGVGISLVVVGRWRRIGALIGYAIIGGLGLAGILQGWFGSLEGSYVANATAIALALLAVSATIVGLNAIAGRPGLALGAVVFVLVANPISAAAVPVEFLVPPWGAVGQSFPPGASATLLRDLSYFPDANPTVAWLALAIWAAGGVVLAIIGRRSAVEKAAVGAE